MEINTDKMIEEQNVINTRIASEQPIKDTDETVCYVEKPIYTHTNIVEHKGEVLLTRYMFNTIYKVVFAHNVKVVDVLDYMSLNDSTFIKCSIRPGKE